MYVIGLRRGVTAGKIGPVKSQSYNRSAELFIITDHYAA